MKKERIFFKDFFTGYIDCAFWVSEVVYEGFEMLPEYQQKEMIADCEKFYDIATQEDLINNFTWNQAGHDFWLTRNRHGTGFWDRDLEVYDGHNERLTEIAHSFGEYYLDVENYEASYG